MSRPVVWFVAGVLATVLVLGGVVIGVTQFGADAEAQGTWQVKVWRTDVGPGGVDLNIDGEPADPEKHFDDWVRLLGENCDIGPFVELEMSHAITYRCPE